MHRALAAGNGGEARRLAHTLKGAAGTFGGTEVVETAHELEQIARLGRLADAPAALAALETALARLHEALLAL